jgi:hypothetical protein
MAALGQEAELNRACLSVLICSQFGQVQIFPEQEKLGARLAEIRTAFRSDLAESLT